MEKFFASPDKLIHYLIIFSIFLGVLLISYTIIKTILHLIVITFRKFLINKREFIERYICPSIPSTALLLSTFVASTFREIYVLPESLETKLSRFSTTFYTVSIAWLFIKIINSFSAVLRERFIHEDKPSAASIMPLFRKLMKIFVVIVAFLFCLQNWQVDIGSLIAALGVGGIAVALASQKSFENIFGGIVLSIDQPIRVGDFGKFGNFVGTVEDIGLRSVRIRTLDRTLVTFPNTQFSSMEIESFTVRDKLLFSKTIGIRSDTNNNQLKRILEEIKIMLKSETRIEVGAMPVRLIDFKLNSINLEFFFYVNTAIWDEYLVVQQDILLKIKDIVENYGSGLAVPYQAFYLKDPQTKKDS